MIKKNLNTEEQAMLLEHLKGTEEHHSMIIQLLMLTGIRTHELMALKVSDLDVLNETLTIWTAAKDSDGRVLGLPNWYVSRARGKVLGLDPDSKLLGALGYQSTLWQENTVKAVLRRSWQKIKRAVWPSGALRLGIHSLRHTFAVNLYKKYRDPLMVQRALGHKHFSSTQRYLIYSEEEAQIKAVRSLYDVA